MVTIDEEIYKERKPFDPNAPHPDFCPNTQCPYHSRPPKEKWFSFRGHRNNDRHGTVQFYLCGYCERSFSSSSFLVSYYEKVDLSYDVILSYAREGITLKEWARKVKTSPATLKLRLCKIGWLLLAEISDLCLPAAGDLLVLIHGFAQRGEKGYRLLRKIIVLLKSLWEALKTEGLSGERPFLSFMIYGKKNLFACLRLICCTFRYKVDKFRFYHSRHQWE